MGRYVCAVYAQMLERNSGEVGDDDRLAKRPKKICADNRCLREAPAMYPKCCIQQVDSSRLAVVAGLSISGLSGQPRACMFTRVPAWTPKVQNLVTLCCLVFFFFLLASNSSAHSMVVGRRIAAWRNHVLN